MGPLTPSSIAHLSVPPPTRTSPESPLPQRFGLSQVRLKPCLLQVAPWRFLPDPPWGSRHKALFAALALIGMPSTFWVHTPCWEQASGRPVPAPCDQRWDRGRPRVHCGAQCLEGHAGWKGTEVQRHSRRAAAAGSGRLQTGPSVSKAEGGVRASDQKRPCYHGTHGTQPQGPRPQPQESCPPSQGPRPRPQEPHPTTLTPSLIPGTSSPDLRDPIPRP